MLKKTLLAAAVATVVSAPAFSAVEIDKTGWNTTVLAAVTKQAVLSFSTSAQNVDATFTQTGDVKQNGFVTLEIKGNGTFNDSEVRQWLTKVGAEYPALTVAIDAVDSTKAAAAGENVAATSAAATIEAMFKTTTIGADDVIEYGIDLDGKRLRLALAENASNLVSSDAVTDNLVNFKATDPADAATHFFVGAGSSVKFNLTGANQAFNLVSGAEVSIPVAVGALRNASYTADPVSSPALFTLGKLFDLDRTIDAKTNEAKVKYGYTQFGPDAADNTLAYTLNQVTLRNLTSNQNLNLAKVKVTMSGSDLSAFKADENGNVLNYAGNATGLRLATDMKSASATAGVQVIEGSLDADGNPTGTAVVDMSAFTQLAIDPENTKAIDAQNIKLQATILGADQETFEDFSSNLLDLYLVTRDGLRFDTVTTGTTSGNTIFIRDVSEILPEDGGKIFVTITEYAEHGKDANAEGKVLVERAELSTRLPNGGAVTLSPAGVAADVGAEITPARQARFLFEVETNIGEVAVKKDTAEGTDIQTGSQAEGGVLVDFTL